MYFGRDTYNGITKELLVVNLLLISIMSKTSFSESVEMINTDNLVIISNNETTTTSLKIAEFFGKRHDDVLKKIKSLDCSPEFNHRNFAGVEYLDAKGESRPMYNITKDGFVFLTMGFTGSKASKFKEAYINCFNKMEQTLKNNQIQITPEPKSIVELLKQNNIWLETLSAENTELKIVVKDTSKQLEESKAEVIKLAPKAEFVDKTFTNGQTGLSTMKTVAHECGVKIIPLYKLLRDKKVWFYQLNEHAQMENAVMAKYIQSGHFVVKQFWSDRQRCYFDKIFATGKGKLLCWNLIKEGNQSNNQLMDLELA